VCRPRVPPSVERSRFDMKSSVGLFLTGPTQGREITVLAGVNPARPSAKSRSRCPRFPARKTGAARLGNGRDLNAQPGHQRRECAPRAEVFVSGTRQIRRRLPRPTNGGPGGPCLGKGDHDCGRRVSLAGQPPGRPSKKTTTPPSTAGFAEKTTESQPRPLQYHKGTFSPSLARGSFQRSGGA